MSVKVRFAPSPTGFMHIGNARIAIINYLFCKKNNGKFLFRIDDTDILRSKMEYENAIKKDLKWLGINYDETFRQSERLDRYRNVMAGLIDQGHLYQCFESPEELEYKRKIATSKGKPPVYDRESLYLSQTEIDKFKSEGRKAYWRFKLPAKTVSWNDLILGNVSYDLSNVSDPVIIKADGTFLYTFSSVVDDFDSGITHIIRGQDHVTNTAVQIALFDAISQETYSVHFAHLSLLVNRDGSQFSKRLGSMCLEDIRKQGVDPMAIFDLLATLGSSLDTVPFSNIEDLVNYFDLSKFSTNSPKFDIEDILKINRKIIRSKPYSEISEFGISEEAYELIRENIESYGDFHVWKNILNRGFCAEFEPTDSEKNVLNIFLRKFNLDFELSEATLNNLFMEIQREFNLKGRELYHPIRKAITGMKYGPNINSLIEFLGKEEICRRIACYFRE